MKNVKVYITAVALACTFFPVSLKADTGSNLKTAEPTAMTQIRAETLINRLEEIKAMDKSDMDRSEKKELAKEVKAAKKELKASGNGVYLSVGAIIIIALLLILIL